MFPVLFAFGPFELRTINIFLVLSLFVGLFVFWRKGKEEHYEEMMLFDGIILSFLFGLLMARIAFILLNFSNFGWNILSWVDFFSFPGFVQSILFVSSGLFLYRYAKSQKWDVYEILDFWVLAVAASQILIWLGYFFEGVAFGVETSLPWGMTFPSVFEAHHPTQLYFAGFFLLLFLYLSWAEFRYRTFNWYRAGKNTAQTGYLLSTFLLAYGFFALIMSAVTVSAWQWQGFRFDTLAALVMIIAGGIMLYVRSGRHLPFFNRKPKKPNLEEFKV